MNQFIHYLMTVVEFATLYGASCFFVWTSESWKGGAVFMSLMFTAFLWKVAINEFSINSFELEKIDTWTPLTWGLLGSLLGGVSGAVLRFIKRHSGERGGGN
jgi:hypothetical protein